MAFEGPEYIGRHYSKQIKVTAGLPCEAYPRAVSPRSAQLRTGDHKSLTLRQGFRRWLANPKETDENSLLITGKFPPGENRTCASPENRYGSPSRPFGLIPQRTPGGAQFI